MCVGGGGDEPRFHKLQEAGPRSFFFVKTPGVRAENCGIFSCLYLRKYVNAECSAIVSECKGMLPAPGAQPDVTLRESRVPRPAPPETRALEGARASGLGRAADSSGQARRLLEPVSKTWGVSRMSASGSVVTNVHRAHAATLGALAAGSNLTCLPAAGDGGVTGVAAPSHGRSRLHSTRVISERYTQPPRASQRPQHRGPPASQRAAQARASNLL